MHKDILLVEDNPDDVELTRLAFDEAKIANRLVVVGDGAEDAARHASPPGSVRPALRA